MGVGAGGMVLGESEGGIAGHRGDGGAVEWVLGVQATAQVRLQPLQPRLGYSCYSPG